MYMFELENKPLIAEFDKRVRKFPINVMEVGQSFYVADKSKYRAAGVACSQYKRLNKGTVFAIRTEGEGFRVYRTA